MIDDEVETHELAVSGEIRHRLTRGPSGEERTIGRCFGSRQRTIRMGVKGGARHAQHVTEQQLRVERRGLVAHPTDRTCE